MDSQLNYVRLLMVASGPAIRWSRMGGMVPTRPAGRKVQSSAKASIRGEIERQPRKLGHRQDDVMALGRKNFLFAGADCGGERASAIYSLIGTAKLNEIDPESHLRHVLARIAEHPNNRIEEMMPWRVPHASARGRSTFA